MRIGIFLSALNLTLFLGTSPVHAGRIYAELPSGFEIPAEDFPYIQITPLPNKPGETFRIVYETCRKISDAEPKCVPIGDPRGYSEKELSEIRSDEVLRSIGSAFVLDLFFGVLTAKIFQEYLFGSILTLVDPKLRQESKQIAETARVTEHIGTPQDRIQLQGYFKRWVAHIQPKVDQFFKDRPEWMRYAVLWVAPVAATVGTFETAFFYTSFHQRRKASKEIFSLSMGNPTRIFYFPDLDFIDIQDYLSRTLEKQNPLLTSPQQAK